MLAIPAVLVCLLAGVVPASAQSTSSSNGWRVTVYPVFGWVPVFGADVTLPEHPCGDCGGGPVIPDGHVSGGFDGAAFAGARVEKGRWMGEAQLLWAGMEGELERPFLHVNAGLVFGEARGGFAVVPNLYIEAGVRRLALDIGARAFDFDEVKWKPGFWEPVIGASYAPTLNARTRLYVHGDYGAEGDNRSAALTGRVEWKAMRHLSITAGYGLIYLGANGSIGPKPITIDQTLHGPIVGIGIPF